MTMTPECLRRFSTKPADKQALIGLSANIRSELQKSVADDYARYIAEDIMADVVEDVVTSSDWENNYHYNDSDIRLAIGRVLMKRLAIIV